MRSTTILFLLIVYFINTSSPINAIQDQCSCSCCIGLSCNPIQKPDFYIPLCLDDAACVTSCKMKYPADCNHIDSQTFAICISGASKISNQYVVLLLSVLFYRTFNIFRI